MRSITVNIKTGFEHTYKTTDILVALQNYYPETIFWVREVKQRKKVCRCGKGKKIYGSGWHCPYCGGKIKGKEEK